MRNPAGRASTATAPKPTAGAAGSRARLGPSGNQLNTPRPQMKKKAKRARGRTMRAVNEVIPWYRVASGDGSSARKGSCRRRARVSGKSLPCGIESLAMTTDSAVGREPEASMTSELDLMVRVQKAVRDTPFIQCANHLSTAGEHAATWLALTGAGVVLDRRRRPQWMKAFASVFCAHAAAVVLKRIVRRRRPFDPRVEVWDKVPSDLSFPSAHATSTAAFACSLPSVLPPRFRPAAVVTGSTLVAAMGGARVSLGVHYPSDVLAGAVIGATVTVIVNKLEWCVATRRQS